MSPWRAFQLGHALVDSPLPPDAVKPAMDELVERGVRIEGMTRPVRRVPFRGSQRSGFALACGELGVAMRLEWSAGATGGSRVRVWADATLGEASSIGPAFIVAGLSLGSFAALLFVATLVFRLPRFVDSAKLLGIAGPFWAGIGWLRFRMWRGVAKYTLVPFRQAIADQLRGPLLPAASDAPATRSS